MAIAFQELASSPLETFGPEGMKTTRQIVVAWEQRHAMVAQLWGDVNAGQAVQISVEAWPPSPNQQGVFGDIASQLSSQSGKYAQIMVQYEMAGTAPGREDLPQPPEGTFLTYRMAFGREYLSVPASGMAWSSADETPVAPEPALTVLVPTIEHHVTWHRVVNPPWSAIRACIGTVNADEFLGAAPETVLLAGATARPEFLGLNELDQPQCGWSIGYRFREMAIKAAGSVYGWNYRYRDLPADAPGWDKLVDRNGEGLYRTADFQTLLEC